MKNQIMEYDRYVGMGRKYGAVKVTTLKNTPITFEFIQDQNAEKNKNKKETNWYLIIDSKDQEVQINCENIEEFSEQKDGRLQLIYYLPDDGNKMQRKEGKFECCENGLVLKTYIGINKTLVENYGSQEKFKER